MKLQFIFPIIIIFIFGCSLPANYPIDLECEHQNDPLGVDVPFPRLSWSISNRGSEHRNCVYEIAVSSDSLDLAAGRADMWRYSIVNPANFLVNYNGERLMPFTRYYWLVECRTKRGRTARSSIHSFETGAQNGANLQGMMLAAPPTGVDSATVFAKNFVLMETPQSARLYVSANRNSVITINGQSIPTSGIPDYGSKRFLYALFDVSGLVQTGSNRIEIIYDTRANVRFSEIPFFANLRINFSDGTSDIISSDNSWFRSTVPADLCFAFFGADSKNNHNVRLRDDFLWSEAAEYRAIPSEIIKAMNFTGGNYDRGSVFRLESQGDTIHNIWFEEMVQGKVALRLKTDSARVRLKYNVSGKYPFVSRLTSDNSEKDLNYYIGSDTTYIYPIFENFIFDHLTIITDRAVFIDEQDIIPITITTAPELTGGIDSSDETISSIYEKMEDMVRVWSYGSNYSGEPYGGLIKFANQGGFWSTNMSVHLDFASTLNYGIRDYLTGIRETVSVTDPFTQIDPAVFETPLLYYVFYGDISLINELYSDLREYLNSNIRPSSDGLISYGFDIGEASKQRGNGQFIESAVLYRSLYYMSIMSDLTGQSDAAKYFAWMDQIRSSLYEKFLTPPRAYERRTVTELALVLNYGIVPDESAQRTAQILAEKIEESNFVLTHESGFIFEILSALGKYGRSGTAYKIIEFFLNLENNYRPLGWIAKIPGQQDNYLVAGVEYTVGQIVRWFYQKAAGIDFDYISGFKSLILNPLLIPNVDNLDVSHQTPYGEIRASWFLQADGTAVYVVDLPASTTARVILPQYREDSPPVYIGSGKHRFNTTRDR